jgi:plasmid stabilization system protein ParE
MALQGLPSQLLTSRTFRVSPRFEKQLIFYQPYSDRIEILRVVHGSQDLVELFDNEGID